VIFACITQDLFVDVKRNDNGVYVKISERKGQKRNTVLFPASCLGDLVSALREAESATSGLGVQGSRYIITPPVLHIDISMR
jgi:hypothetical protein